MTNKKSTLFQQGTTCVTLLVIGISGTPLIPQDLRGKIFPLALLILALNLFITIYHQVKHSEKDIKREQRDERNQMILERAALYSCRAGDWILLVLCAVFGLLFNRFEISYTLIWVLIGRNLLFFCIRWRLDKKY